MFCGGKIKKEHLCVLHRLLLIYMLKIKECISQLNHRCVFFVVVFFKFNYAFLFHSRGLTDENLAVLFPVNRTSKQSLSRLKLPKCCLSMKKKNKKTNFGLNFYFHMYNLLFYTTSFCKQTSKNNKSERRFWCDCFQHFGTFISFIV